jgi:hypothetical protein
MKRSDGKDDGTLPLFPKSDRELLGEDRFLEEIRPGSCAASNETEYRNQADGYFD